MKKFYLLILVAMISLPGLTAKSQDFAPSYWQTDSVWYYRWDVPTTAWNHYERELLARNSNGNMTSDTYLVIDEPTLEWENSFRYRYEYTSSGSTETTFTETWNTATSEWKTLGYTHYNSNGNIDEAYSLVWEEASQTYTVGTRQLSTYGSNNEKLQTLSQRWDAATQAWQEYIRYTYTYTTTGKPDVTLTELWNDAIPGFENSAKDIYAYNAQDQQSQLTSQMWNSVTTTWYDYSRRTYTYDPFGNILLMVQEAYDLVATAWVYEYGTDYAFNPDNQLIEEIVMKWNTAKSGWEFYSKLTNTYYPNKYMDESSSYTWNPLLMGWMATSYYKYLESGSYASYFYKTIDMTTYAYIYGYKYDYTFNTLNQVDLVEGYNLNILTNGWDAISRDVYTYDAGNHQSEINSTAWNESLLAWENTFKQKYFGSENHIGISQPGNLSDICIFQNPLKAGAAVVCSALEQGKTYNLSLYSASGQLVSHSQITNGEKLVLSGNLNTGMYLMQLTDEKSVIARGKVLLIN